MARRQIWLKCQYLLAKTTGLLQITRRQSLKPLAE